MRDHGGNLDQAIARFGGEAADWIDLSTGINRCPYPVPPLTASAWSDLPTGAALRRLTGVAARTYRAGAPLFPVAGAQAAIQMLPRILPRGEARILSPTYNEHAAGFSAAGWQVREVRALADLAGADAAVIVNPNNPDGRTLGRDQVLQLAGQVGRLIVDESFADPRPELSVADAVGQENLIVLRSFGKFYGLAGVRLGFVIAAGPVIADLAVLAGPWPVSGAAIEIGCAALADRPWAEATIARLRAETVRLDGIAVAAGWKLVGGCELFRLYDTGEDADAADRAQTRLAESHIWSRRFPWSPSFIRLGLPGTEMEWKRLEQSLI